MQLLCERDGETAVLATEVETADSFLAQMRGLMFRRSIPDEYALVFRFDEVGSRDVHMLFVPFPIDVLWVVDGTVEKKARLSPWTGLGKAEADMLIELPAGAGDAVEEGDTVRISDSDARPSTERSYSAEAAESSYSEETAESHNEEDVDGLDDEWW